MKMIDKEDAIDETQIEAYLDRYEAFVDKVWMGRKAKDPDNEWEVKYLALRDLFIMTVGLGGETGELLEKIKKHVRDDTVDVEALKKECGDILYYLTKIGQQYGFGILDMVETNVSKLEGRIERGTMKGSGDNR
jgi:NTP pyrophosphatase (non-canonical NTP hydrolase)